MLGIPLNQDEILHLINNLKEIGATKPVWNTLPHTKGTFWYLVMFVYALFESSLSSGSFMEQMEKGTRCSGSRKREKKLKETTTDRFSTRCVLANVGTYGSQTL